MTANPADGGNDWIPNSVGKWKYLLAVQWPMRDLREVEWNVSSSTSPLYYSRVSQSESWLWGGGGLSLETPRASQSSLALVEITGWDINSLLGSKEGKKKEWGVIIRPHLSAWLIFLPSLSDLNALHVLLASRCTCRKSLTICLFLSGFILLAIFFCDTQPLTSSSSFILLSYIFLAV